MLTWTPACDWFAVKKAAAKIVKAIKINFFIVLLALIWTQQADLYSNFFSEHPECLTATIQTSSSNSDFFENAHASASIALNNSSAGRAACECTVSITEFSPNCSPSGDSTS